jgi:hypothetical protein
MKSALKDSRVIGNLALTLEQFKGKCHLSTFPSGSVIFLYESTRSLSFSLSHVEERKWNRCTFILFDTFYSMQPSYFASLIFSIMISLSRSSFLIPLYATLLLAAFAVTIHISSTLSRTSPRQYR